MKVRTATFSIFVIIALLIFSQCKWGKPERNKEHDFAALQEFKKLSREDQVKKCGSCHKEIYENEMKGPHSHAYFNLEAHINFINGAKYDYEKYKTFVNNNNNLCYTCHTSKNMYEGAFAITGADFSINQDKKIETRNAIERTTGIDCITCHFDGKQVITGGGFKPSEKADSCPGYCNPIASKFFSSNANCQPCHFEQFDDVVATNTANHTELTCGGCHQEKNTQGKYTHYTSGRIMPLVKQSPKYLNLFNGISANYDAKDNAFKLVWRNKYMPHRASACTELVALIEIKDDDKTVRRDTMRLNRRVKHLDDMAHKISVTDFPGVTGYEFKTLNDSVVKSIPAPAKHGNYSISITGIKKEQYWLNDSINTVYYKKSAAL